MNRQDLFERILSSLHASVLDDALWPATSGLIDEFFGVKGNILGIGDGTAENGDEVSFGRFCFRGQRHTALEREYFDFWQTVDERIPHIASCPTAGWRPIPRCSPRKSSRPRRCTTS